MTTWANVDDDWASDHRRVSRPRDRMAVASVVLSSLWLWWVGSLVGLVLGLVALARARRGPHPFTSRRWAWTGITLGLIGVFTFSVFVAPPLFSRTRHHFQDRTARASLADFVTTLHEENARSQGFPVVPVSTAPWKLAGGSGVVVVGPETSSTDDKTVSAEVWDLWATPEPTHGATVYASVLSGTGTCFYLKQTRNSEFATVPSDGVGCTADSARGITDWESSPGVSPTGT